MASASKRYTRRFVFWMMVYSVAVIVTSGINDRVELATPWRAALAVAPVIPALFALRELLIFFRTLDEVQARIHSEAILLSAGIVGFGTFAWGFVELWLALPRVPIILVLPALIAVWGIARPFVARRYQ